MRLQVKPPKIYKGKSYAFFTPQEEEESAKDCRFTIVGKFSHGKPTIDDTRRDFVARFPLKGTASNGIILIGMLCCGLHIDKATNAKARPNYAKVMVEIDLAVQRRKFIWVGIKEEDAYGKKDPTKTVGINATQNIASSCNNRNGEFNYHKEGDKMLYCPLWLENLSRSRQRIQQGIKAKLNKKSMMKWVARPPKDNNLQQKLSQAKDVIHDFLRSSKVIDVDTGITNGGKELEWEVGKVQFEIHLPAVKPITTSNSFKHLEEFDKDREVCYSEGMKKASSAANIASSRNTSSTTIINTRQTVTLKDDIEIYAQNKLTKPDRDFAIKLQNKSPYVLDNYCPILSGKPPKNVHNEAQGINLEGQLWSPNSLVDVPAG
ncbi:hypothetical protein KY285_007589 [Solanum tuberosum]|nr:hypothetical protein KY285_007589 [Solanum tuberosum]